MIWSLEFYKLFIRQIYINDLYYYKLFIQISEKIMIIIKTSSNKLSILKNIAKYLIKNKLAGCVNLLPGGTSFFSWETIEKSRCK